MSSLPARSLATVALVLVSCAAPQDTNLPSPPPDIVLVVVDTLRADRMGVYGAERPTTAEIERTLAVPGAVFETAYSQAPWTLPSASSYLSGLYPSQFPDPPEGDEPTYAMPASLPTLAERLQDLGYETAAFIANPVLAVEPAFERGFETFWHAEEKVEALALSATEQIQPRVLAFLDERAKQRVEESGEDLRPLFLYVHYVDPHDPYLNSDLLPGGRSPFEPDNGSPLTGDDVHALYVGAREVEGAEDMAHLRALYDSEIAFVDRAVGELVDRVSERSGPAPLVVLTSDHGEELFDHGGWKHGQALYDEQIRVPLLMRWDGEIQAGGRLDGTVRLVDLAPTLVSAAGGDVAAQAREADWRGVDLLPTLREGEPLRRRPAYAAGLSFGPQRRAAVLDGVKLIRFAADQPCAPRDDTQRLVCERDKARLEPLEIYDLRADPLEQTNLAARFESAPEEVSQRVREAIPVLEEVLRRHAEGERSAGAGERASEQLRKLGYLN